MNALTAEQESALHEAEKWMASATCQLARNDCSRVHKLNEAFRRGQILGMQSRALSTPTGEIYPNNGAFVIAHDWYAALHKAAHEAGPCDEMHLPYPACAFEFMANGTPAIILLARDIILVGGAGCIQGVTAQVFVAVKEQWVFCGHVQEGPDQGVVINTLWAQTLAAFVAIDSGVATARNVAPPEKLNRKRARSGQSPIFGYSVIELAKPRHSRNTRGQPTTGEKVRLHFRRGHWRHLEDRKTWVKWHLVGNPDLGFIDHHYKL